MINAGVLYKSWRETRWNILLFSGGLFLFETILAAIFPDIAEQVSQQMMQIPLVQNMLSGLLGVELSDNLPLQALGAFAWVHPVVLALIWSFEIMFCTRTPAAEIDRGSADMTLALPVSRRQIYLSESVMFVAAGLFMLSCGLLGYLVGSSGTEGALRLPILVKILGNLFCVYLAVGGVAFMASSFCNRRGHAVGLAFAATLASFFLNFLVQNWAPAKSAAFLSLLHYYKPMNVVRAAQWPLADMATLAGTGALFWLVGWLIFRRRDIAP